MGLPLRTTILVASLSAVAATGCDRLRAKNGDVVATMPNESYAPICAAVDATHVYWTASGHVFRVPRDASGASLEDFAATDGEPQGIAVLGPDVLWIDEATNTLFAKPKAGGAARAVAKVDKAPVAWCVVEDDAALYASGRPPSLASPWRKGVRSFERAAVVVRIDKKTGAMTELERDETSDLLVGLDATHVYVQPRQRPYRVHRIAKTGGAKQELDTRDPRLDPPGGDPDDGFGPNRRMLAVVGDDLYVATPNNLFVVAKTGGVPRELGLGARSLVVDGGRGPCFDDGASLTCNDASGRGRRYAYGHFPRWAGVQGDAIYWFGTTPSHELRRAKL